MVLDRKATLASIKCDRLFAQIRNACVEGSHRAPWIERLIAPGALTLWNVVRVTAGGQYRRVTKRQELIGQRASLRVASSAKPEVTMPQKLKPEAVIPDAKAQHLKQEFGRRRIPRDKYLQIMRDVIKYYADLPPAEQAEFIDKSRRRAMLGGVGPEASLINSHYTMQGHQLCGAHPRSRSPSTTPRRMGLTIHKLGVYRVGGFMSYENPFRYHFVRSIGVMDEGNMRRCLVIMLLTLSWSEVGNWSMSTSGIRSTKWWEVGVRAISRSPTTSCTIAHNLADANMPVYAETLPHNDVLHDARISGGIFMAFTTMAARRADVCGEALLKDTVVFMTIIWFARPRAAMLALCDRIVGGVGQQQLLFTVTRTILAAPRAPEEDRAEGGDDQLPWWQPGPTAPAPTRAVEVLNVCDESRGSQVFQGGQESGNCLCQAGGAHQIV